MGSAKVARFVAARQPLALTMDREGRAIRPEATVAVPVPTAAMQDQPEPANGHSALARVYVMGVRHVLVLGVVAPWG